MQSSQLVEPVCTHCGSPVKDSSLQFCCRGCEFVYGTLKKLGLTGYYRLRSVDAELRPALEVKLDPHYGYLEQEDLQNKYVQVLEGSLRRIRFYLPSIHCAACVWLLERLPLVVPGILKSRVNFGACKIELEYDQQIISLAHLASVLNAVGYPAVPAAFANEAALEKEDRELLRRIGVAALSAANTMVLAVSLFQGFFTGIEEPYGSLFRWLSALLTLPAVAYSAVPFYRTAIGSLYLGSLHIDLPISIAIVSAYLGGIITLFRGGEYIYFDSVSALIFLLLLGRYVQKRAIHKSRASALTAWDLLPMTVRSLHGSKIVEKPIQELAVGDLLQVLPLERIPADGLIVNGSSTVNTAFLSGESIPTSVTTGDLVFAGSMNVDGTIELKVNKVAEQSRLGRILADLELTQDTKTPIESIANRLSGYFVFGALLISGITYLVWSLIDPSKAFDSAVALLIVTCPCALGLATPVAVTVGMSRARRAKVFVKRAEALETLARIQTIYFDKTGTLTSAVITVCRAEVKAGDLPVIGGLSAYARSHPVAEAISKYCGIIHPLPVFDSIRLVPGSGIEGLSSGNTLRLGSLAWCKKLGIRFSDEQLEILNEADREGVALSLFCRDDQLEGIFCLSDTVRAEAKLLVEQLQKKNKKVFILSGDRASVVKRVARQLGIPQADALGDLSPEQKASIISRDNSITAMIGDGVNDALAMNASRVSIALRGGIEATLENADIFVASGELDGVSKVIGFANEMMKTIRRNFCFSVFYNSIGIISAVSGYVTPLVAAVLMPLSSLTVIFSSIVGCSFKNSQKGNKIWE